MMVPPPMPRAARLFYTPRASPARHCSLSRCLLRRHADYAVYTRDRYNGFAGDAIVVAARAARSVRFC